MRDVKETLLSMTPALLPTNSAQHSPLTQPNEKQCKSEIKNCSCVAPDWLSEGGRGRLGGMGLCADAADAAVPSTSVQAQRQKEKMQAKGCSKNGQNKPKTQMQNKSAKRKTAKEAANELE